MRKIQIELPEQAEDIIVQYEKIAEREEAESVEIPLKNDIEYDETIYVGTENQTVIEDVEDGVYQIQISGDSEYEFAPILVSMPFWDEQLCEMSYEAVVFPKYNRKVEPPITGDDTNGFIYVVFGIISLIIVVLMSCHKYLKCGRMSHKYSKRRRT